MIINCDEKPLPWKGFKKHYNKENENFVYTRDYDKMLQIFQYVDQQKPDVDLIVVDTVFYAIMNEFMDKAKIKSFEKFTDMGLNVWRLIESVKYLKRDDLTVAFFSHTEREEFQRVFSAPGKLVKEKLKPEGLCTVVLEAQVDHTGDSPKFEFLTQHMGDGLAKAPEGMFPTRTIPNDMQYVLDCMHAYYEGEDIPEQKQENELA